MMEKNEFLRIKKKQMKKNLLTLLLFFLFVGISFSQTALEGKVTQEDTGEPVLFGTLALFKNGVLITGTDTDVDGNYFFSGIEPGTYDVEATYVGLTTSRVTDVIIKAGKTNRLDIVMKPNQNMLDVVEIIDYKVPL
ncbi:MAG TPA: carboxypeptidase-like regulatory domain-containing protein, partial [Saprospiraceae bacterium]|nr:carboxypeptidase-like regulatory domain-containing protein [Saprospiraceae bacterium]